LLIGLDKHLDIGYIITMFRLHIDIPLDTDETTAAILSENLVNMFVSNINPVSNGIVLTEVNYRLGNDDDRQKSNYLIKTESGHVANKKSRISLIVKNETTDG
jgi:hypothetical protein